MRIGTLNATCWNSWVEAAKVEQQSADMWLVQEHKICCPKQIRRTRKELSKQGLSSVFGPGRITEKLGKSGGAAIICSQHLDILQRLQRLQPPKGLEHRAAGVRANIAGVELQLWSLRGDHKDSVVTQQLVAAACRRAHRGVQRGGPLC